jgi:uncharacterized protein YfeS
MFSNGAGIYCLNLFCASLHITVNLHHFASAVVDNFSLNCRNNKLPWGRTEGEGIFKLKSICKSLIR